MPIYAYQCEKCGRDEEYIQKFSDPPMTTCEHCGGALHRKLTSAAFHLKGGGWYKDLYASSKPASSEGGGGDGAASPAAPAAATPSPAPASTSTSTPASSSSGGAGTGGSKAAS